MRVCIGRDYVRVGTGGKRAVAVNQRPHRWRKQLYLKGRNMTVAHVVYTMRANDMTPEDAAEEFSRLLLEHRGIGRQRDGRGK